MMELQVSKLREALSRLEPVAPRKPTLPVLVHARLGEGRIVATDLEVAVSLELPEAQEPLLLPVKRALEFLKGVPGHEVAQFKAEGKRVSITANSTRASLESADPMDYPPIPRVEPGQSEGEGVLDGDALVKALAAVAPYAATEQDRPALTGICLTLGEAVKAAAADGFRLAWETVPGKLVGEGSLIVPARAVPVLEGLWKKAAAPDLGQARDPVSVALAKRLIRLGWQREKALLELHFGGVTLTTKLIQGTFPSYQALIPAQNKASATVQAEDMLRALKQLKGIAKESSGIVRLSWEGDTLTVSARAAEVGETAAQVPIQATGPGKTAMNLSYLLEYFSGRAGSVTMALADGNSPGPVTFSHRGTPHVVIMPMFVKWDVAPGQPQVVAEAEQVVEGTEAEENPDSQT